jgi:PAS domain S-box-containing protein
MPKLFKKSQTSKIQNRLIAYYITFAVIVVGLVTYFSYIEIAEQGLLWLAGRIASYVAVMGILILAGLIVIVSFMARQVVIPLRELIQTVSRVAEGDLNVSAPVLSDDEVGTLARAFNTMTEKLRQTLAGLETELQERKQIENDLRDSEERFRTVFESSPIAICITALEDGRLLSANYAYWDLTGYNPEDSIGKTSEELKLWSDVEERNKFVKDLKQNGSFYNPDDSFLDESGDRKDVISFFRLVKIGGEDRIISMLYDMSAQKQTMQALQQSEARVLALLEAIPDMILELTLDGLIVNMSPPKGMEGVMPPENFIGKHVHEIISETAASQTRFALERAVATGHMNVFEFEETMGKTTMILEARLVANTTNTAIMMVRDITQRKWIETEREELINELEVKNRESETLRESLATIAGTFEFSQIVNEILDQIRRVIPYDTASVWRVENNQQYIVSGVGMPPEIKIPGTVLTVNENNSAYPLLLGKLPYILNNNVQDELSDFQEEPHTYIQSWLAIPLKIHGKIIGLIALDGRQKNQFNEHHIEIAVTFSNQVAIALENADLFSNVQMELEERKALIHELEKKNAEAETMREGTAIVAATLEIPETVQRILEQIKRVVQYDSASVWLYHGERAVMVGEIGLPPEMKGPREYIRSTDAPDHRLWNNEDDVLYVLLADTHADYPIFHEPPLNYIHGWLGVSLRARGKLIGFIALDSRTPDKFTEHDAELASIFAKQVSVAIENASLFSDLQTELKERSELIGELETKNIESETLRESTAIVVSTLEISDTVQRILEQVKRVVQYDSASVWLYQDDHAYMMGSNGLPEGAESPGKYKVGKNEPDYAFWKDNVPYILLDDIQEEYPDFRTPPKNYIHGWLTIPLRVRGKLIGFISLDSRQPAKFTVHDAELALTFADQVSIALENARLFSDLEAELNARKVLITELESKNAELERFTYTVSHDLKSPLFTIRGFLGYLEQDALTGNYTRLRSDMQRIVDATNKMQNLLNDLLELSRVGRVGNNPEVIPFEALAREAAEIVHGQIVERGIAVHIHPKLPMVYGDRMRLLEVVQNLMDNASKFMGDQPKPYIEVGQEGEENGKPIFYVRDNGIGISPEHHERVFGLFNKLDVKADGTGIGLALVRRIIDVHGGRIWVQSEAGKGSTFYFTIPPPPLNTEGFSET